MYSTEYHKIGPELITLRIRFPSQMAFFGRRQSVRKLMRIILYVSDPR